MSAELLAANTDEGISCHHLWFVGWFVAFMSYHLLHSLICFMLVTFLTIHLFQFYFADTVHSRIQD